VRHLQRALAGAGLAATPSDGGLLEAAPDPAVPARLEPAPALEGDRVTTRAIVGDPLPGFAAFLDGIQRSVVASYVDGVVPVVHGTVAAVVRRRQDRRLETWRSALVESAAYLPLAHAGAAVTAALAREAVPIHDTAGAGTAAAAGHPQEWLAQARQAVQRRREELEGTLATAWCAGEDAPLYVDGGIGAYAEPSRSALAIGVVKSHRTLYLGADGVAMLAALPPGARTTAFAVATRGRTRVASWYLRLHADADPLAGLVRVEVGEAAFTAERADLVSRWILAERTPVALPDPRWRVMAYGIWDCEEYLRAVAG
jgi:hypothetical protein